MKKLLFVSASLFAISPAFCQITGISTTKAVQIGKAGSDEWPIASLEIVNGKTYNLYLWSYPAEGSPKVFSVGFDGGKALDALYDILVKQFDKDPSEQTIFMLGGHPIVVGKEKDTKRISIYSRRQFCYLELNDVQKLFDRTTPISENAPMPRKSRIQPIAKIDSSSN